MPIASHDTAAKALYWIGLLLFFAAMLVAGMRYYASQEQRFEALAHRQAQDNLALIGAFIENGLLQQGDPALNEKLDTLGRLQRHALEIRLTDASGLVLAEFRSAIPRTETYSLRDSVELPDQGLMGIELTNDISAIQGNLTRMCWELAAVAGLVGLFFLMVLWERLRRRREATRWRRVSDEAKQATERLAASVHEAQELRQYLTSVLDAIPTIIIGVDRQGRVAEWNLGAEIYTQVKREDARSLLFTDLMPQLNEQFDKVRSVIENGAAARAMRITAIAGGSVRYCELSIYPMTEKTGIDAILQVDDITQRVRFEQMMLQMEKITILGGLAAGVAHEINSPLSGVLQNCQNVQRRLSANLPANSEAAKAAGIQLDKLEDYLRRRHIPEFLHMIRDAAERASRIVSDILAFNRSNKQEFEKVAVEQLLETAVRLSSSDLHMKKHLGFLRQKLIREYAEDLPALYCDVRRLEQVLFHLLKNATQAMAEANTPNPRTITLRTRAEGEAIVIEVEDNGPGMNETVAQRIFDPFYSNKNAELGSGLGLAVAHFIVTDQHGGAIEVRSSEGVGACFTLRLPTHAAANAVTSGFSSLKQVS